MMFGAALFKLVPTLRWPGVTPANGAGSEQIAIDTCISAVQIYFPCEPSATTTNYTSLCEQYTWRVACYDNHGSTPSSHRDRATIETQMNTHCRAAGSLDAAMVQRQYHAQRRQIGSILSSIGGDITSFLSSASITIALPTLASNTPATSAPPALTTSAPQQSTLQSVQSLRSTLGSGTTPTPSRSLTSSQATNTRSDLAGSTSSAAAASSSKNSGPSTGLIAGAVIGSVAVLILLGILLMLILRHKRRKAATKTSTVENGLGNQAGTYRGEPSVETITTTHNGASVADDEKSVFQRRDSNVAPMSPVSPLGSPPPMPVPMSMSVPPARRSEMPTSANVWELEGRERPMPAELEAGHAYIPYRAGRGDGREDVR